MKFDEIKYLNVNFFKLNNNIISNQNKKILDNFINLYYSYNNPLIYKCQIIQNEISSKKTKFLIIQYNNDKILLMYKITMFIPSKKTQLIHILNIPLSLNKNYDNIKLVINQLLKLQFIKFIFSQNYKFLFSNYIQKSTYNNYYYDLKYQFENHHSNKWKRSIGVNKFYQNNDYKIINSNIDKLNINEILQMRKQWWKNKPKSKNDNKDSSQKSLEKILNLNNKNILSIGLKYKNKLLAISIIIINEKLQYATDLFYFHIGRNKQLLLQNYPEISNTVISNLEDCSKYIIGEYLISNNILFNYRLGYRQGYSSLKKHKQNISTGTIKYFITK